MVARAAACRYVVPVLGSPTCSTTRVIGGRGRVMPPSWQRARVAFAHVSTSPSRVYVARLVGLPIFDPQGDQVGKVRDLVVARPVRGQPAARARPGGRGVRSAADLRADDPGHQHRQRAGLHDRAAQHAPLRAAADRDAGRGPAVRPHGDRDGDGRDRHRLRRRHGAGPQPRLGAQPGGDPGAGQGPAPARPDPRRGVGRGRGPDPARAHPGRHPADPRAQRAAPRRRRQRDPRPAVRAAIGRGRGAHRRAARRRARGAARGGPGRDHGPARERAGRRRPRGDGPRRRRRPDRRAAAGDRRDRCSS